MKQKDIFYCIYITLTKGWTQTDCSRLFLAEISAPAPHQTPLSPSSFYTLDSSLLVSFPWRLTNLSFLIQNGAAERTTGSIHQLVPKLHSFSMLVLFLLKLMRIITWRQISSPLCPRNHSFLKMKSDIHLIINPCFLRYWESFWGKLQDISGNRKKGDMKYIGILATWELLIFKELQKAETQKYPQNGILLLNC